LVMICLKKVKKKKVAQTNTNKKIIRNKKKNSKTPDYRLI